MSKFTELTVEEQQNINGGAWWIVAGWIAKGIGWGCGLAGAVVDLCGGDRKVASGLRIAGVVCGVAGTVLTGIK